MRHDTRLLPSVALLVTAAMLLYGGSRLRQSAAERSDLRMRQAFAESVQRGERPSVGVPAMAGVLRQELEAQQRAAAERARLATVLDVTALLSLVGLIGIRARRSRPGVEPSAHPGGPFGRAPTV